MVNSIFNVGGWYAGGVINTTYQASGATTGNFAITQTNYDVPDNGHVLLGRKVIANASQDFILIR